MKHSHIPLFCCLCLGVFLGDYCIASSAERTAPKRVVSLNLCADELLLLLADPEQIVESELVSALREIVATLPEAQRRIVWADALNPHGPVDGGVLAEELGIPPGTVRVYRKRGLDRIRKELERRNLSPQEK